MGETTGGESPPHDLDVQSNNTNKPLDASQNKIEKNEIIQYDLNNRYRFNDKGPFIVYIEHKEKNIGRLFPIRIGHFLRKDIRFKNNIVDMKSIGKNRVKIFCKNYETANTLIDHELIITNNLVAYIPTFFTQKKGIIKMVDTYFKEEYIKENIESNIKVLSVKRLKRKLFDETSKQNIFVDRQMVILTFLGNNIPDTVKINMVNFIVEPYIYPVVQCFNCLRYGHTNKMCKSARKCQRCGQENCTFDDCVNHQICLHCNSSEHSSMSRTCSVYIKQKNIKIIMANENISFKEAEVISNNPSYSKIVTNNRFSILANHENFPSLPVPNLKNQIHTNNFIRKPIPKKQTVNITNETTKHSSKRRKHSTSPLQSPSIEKEHHKTLHLPQPISGRITKI